MEKFTEARTSGKVEVGQVINSPHFVDGHTQVGKKIIFVGGPNGDAIDETRATALYVVIHARLTRSKDEVGFSSWPDGWLVVARRLNSKEKDDGRGETIAFHQYFKHGDASYGLIPEVNVVGTMEQRFV
jgi:hypothetical protein